jgi:tetratricopeptide (TPR) repeat protein
MRWVLAGFAVGLAAVGGMARPGAADEADMRQGQAYLMQGEFQRAIESLTGAIAEDPEYAPAYIVRGQAWRYSGEPRKAADDFSQAMTLGLDRSAYLFTLRADARAAGGDHAAALADYDQALAVRPGFWPALAGRGAALAARGDTAAALAALDKALATNPGPTITEVLKSEQFRVLSRKGPPGRGTSTLSVTIQTLPLVASTYAARGRVRFTQGNYAPALADFNEALKRLPNLATARLHRGLTYFALGRCREGEADLHALRELGAAQLKAAVDPHRAVAAKAGCPLPN